MPTPNSLNLVCPKCDHSIPRDSDFCPFCGAKIETQAQNALCKKCGKAISADIEFCPFCGNDIKTEAATEANTTDAFCLKCGTPLQDGDAFCKKCGTKKGFDPKQIYCKNCNSPISEDSEFCPKCGAKNKQSAKRIKRKKYTIIISALIVIIISLVIFAFPPIYQAALQKEVDRAVLLANQRRFIEANNCIISFEEKNNPSFGLDTDDAAYRKLKDYIEAGTYYEKGEYIIARNKFSYLGDYRASKILADECNRLAVTSTGGE